MKSEFLEENNEFIRSFW